MVQIFLSVHFSQTIGTKRICALLGLETAIFLCNYIVTQNVVYTKEEYHNDY